MKDAQKPDHISLTTLITRLKEGRFVIPDFQREFEWRPADVRELMRSIFLDYYIGSLLLWKGKKENFDALACEKLYAYNGDGKPEHIVLDGQQRLTAIYYSFVAPNKNLPNRSNRYLFFIHVDQFMDQAYDKAFEYDWTQAGAKLIEEPETQYERHIFPLSVVGKGGWALGNWVQAYEKFWNNKATKGANFNGKHYKTLAGKLEYCDLRELQASITNAALWGLFEPQFKNKVTLDAKFDQLAELRNAIRHSRQVDGVRRKEGEAAILWFGKVLQK